MDEVKIESRLLRKLVSRLIKHEIKKKIGYDIDIALNSFHISSVNGEILAHLDIDATMSKEEFERIIKDKVH